jgi:hypothetical protein
VAISLSFTGSPIHPPSRCSQTCALRPSPDRSWVRSGRGYMRAINALQSEGLVSHECSSPQRFVDLEWDAERCLYCGSAPSTVNVVGHSWKVGFGPGAGSTQVVSLQHAWPLSGFATTDFEFGVAGFIQGRVLLGWTLHVASDRPSGPVGRSHFPGVLAGRWALGTGDHIPHS